MRGASWFGGHLGHLGQMLIVESGSEGHSAVGNSSMIINIFANTEVSCSERPRDFTALVTISDDFADPPLQL